jgi:prepilin-type N-terminal cleavage/methylation domain-containing protein
MPWSVISAVTKTVTDKCCEAIAAAVIRSHRVIKTRKNPQANQNNLEQTHEPGWHELCKDVDRVVRSHLTPNASPQPRRFTMRKGFTLIELMIVIAIIAIIAAIAIPNLLESRVTANEAAASTSLKSGIFPAEVQFTGGGYQDADADLTGEYGPLQALSGRVATLRNAVGELKLLSGPLGAADNAGLVSANGYHFTSFAPSATVALTGVTSTAWLEADAACPILTVAPATANNGERFFIVGCAPEKYSDTGRRVFAITQDGQIRSPATAAQIAKWFGAAPVNGQSATLAQIQEGLADVFGVAAYAITMMDTAGGSPVYPTLTK